ncbi:hypothetical protein LV779_06195 [Streptomyces thinghirensis]|nr:hypothetical protein [Streptomyces thinghirensis]
MIGLSALVIGVLGQVHVACGSPARGDGMQAIGTPVASSAGARRPRCRTR